MKNSIESMPSGNSDYTQHMWVKGYDAGREHAKQGRQAPTPNLHAGSFYQGFVAGYQSMEAEANASQHIA